MTPAPLIARKRDGGELSPGEIAFLMRGFVDGSVPDYQMAALAMAVFFRGMTDAETVALTDEMLHSGVQLEWPAGPAVVDKHSTGGIGDKVSLVLAPLLASCGLRVPMISGRGLGPTGGTLDKLESIPGFRTDLSIREMQTVVDRVGCVITGASDQLAPADRKLYALRDVTGTVPSIPLITASIMSKKLAESLDALILDVKCGSGAFMKTPAEARALAESLVRTGRRMGVATRALITDMNQPLGRMCGNAVEVNESLDCLSGSGPDDLRELTISLGAELLVAAGHSESVSVARTTLIDRLDSGAAREKFEQMVDAQGGDLAPSRSIAAEFPVTAEQSGYVTAIDTEALGQSVIDLGGGRCRAGDTIDHSVGIDCVAWLGQKIQPGDLLARVFARESSPGIEADIRRAIQIGDESATLPPFIVEKLS
ncbi:thymidine phosphorylase [bacterium]|nr:thymidine phosphorylase [bacterium]